MSSSAAIFHLLVILYSSSFVCSQTTCDPNTPKMATLRLKKDLLCGYDKQVRPVIHHENQTKVIIVIVPRYLDFEESTGILKLSSWFGMTWTDQHLRWDPLEYDFAYSINLDSKTIWVPDLSVYNSATVDMAFDSIAVPCIVNMQGVVHTVRQTEHLFHCISDWSNWPYDKHTCEMTIGSKAYIGSRLDIDFLNNKGIYMGYLVSHREWDVVNSSITRNITYIGPKNDVSLYYLVSLNVKFILKRHASVYVASYVIPGVVMMLMSLCIPWMDTSRSERINVLCALTILQSLYLQYIAYKLPSNGDKMPRVVCFYRDSLFITGLLFAVTVITRQMSLWTMKLASLQTVSNFMANSKAAQLIMLIDSDPKNSAELTETGEEAVTLLIRDQGGPHQWQMLSVLINRLTFLFVFIIYLYLSLYLLP